MNRLFSAKTLAIAAVAAGALAAASAAQASDRVNWSIGINVPGAYVQPAPVYYNPAPVYYNPAPVYYEPAPVYYESAPVYVAPRSSYYVQSAPVYYSGARWNGHRPHHRNGAWGDADRDGVPNRFDRAPNNPYRR